MALWHTHTYIPQLRMRSMSMSVTDLINVPYFTVNAHYLFFSLFLLQCGDILRRSKENTEQ